MLCKSVSLIELSKKLFEGSRTPSQGVSSRKKAQQIRSHPFHFPRGVLGCHPHHLYCFGDRIANHSSSVTGGWFLFTCLMAFTTPPPPFFTVTSLCSESFIPFPSRSVSGIHLKADHTWAGGSGILTVFLISHLGVGHVFEIQTWTPAPALGGGMWAGTVGFLKNHFGARPRESPRAACP